MVTDLWMLRHSPLRNGKGTAGKSNDDYPDKKADAQSFQKAYGSAFRANMVMSAVVGPNIVVRGVVGLDEGCLRGAGLCFLVQALRRGVSRVGWGWCCELIAPHIG